MAWTPKKIYELSAHSSIVSTDVLPISATDSWNAEKSTIAELDTYLSASTSTLTNKTIDADNNTISNLALWAEVTGASTDLTDTTALTYNADTDVSGNGWVLDEDNMASDSATKVPTQQSVKAYVDASSSWVSDWDKGDITVSSSGTVWTIDNWVVTVAKLSATGTPDSSTFLRWDGTWATPAWAWDVTAASAFGTDNVLIKSDGTGKWVQATWISVDDSNNVTGINNVTGSDTNLVTGTAGTDWNPAMWNTDWDVVDFSMATNRILGRDTAGNGAVEQLTGNTVRDLISLWTSDSPQFTWVNIWHATDTTITRVSAGVIAVEWVTIPTISSTSTLTNKTIDLANNTLTGTTAEFNTALSDWDFATLAGTETLSNKTLTSPVISSISNTGTLTLPTSTDTLVGRATTDTLTNKRITPRVWTTASSATPTINTDNVDMYILTAQAADITSFTTNLSWTPTNWQKLWIAITGTAARAITRWASFENWAVDLPTTTITTQRLDVWFVWNAATSKRRCMAAWPLS